MVKRLDVTEKALKLKPTKRKNMVILMFYQAGGCCEGNPASMF